MGAIFVPGRGSADGPLGEERSAHAHPQRPHRTTSGGQSARRGARSSQAVPAGPGAGPSQIPGRGGRLSRVRHGPSHGAAAAHDAGRSRPAGRGVPLHRYLARVRQPPPSASCHRQRGDRAARPRGAGPRLRPGGRAHRDDARQAGAPGAGARHALAPGVGSASRRGRGGVYVDHERGAVHRRRAPRQGVHRRRRCLSDRALAQARLPPHGGPVHRLPRAADGQPFAVPLLPSAGAHVHRGLVSRGAGARRGRPG